MRGTKFALAVGTLALLVAFVGGPLLHNAVPHSHGSAHRGPASAIWSDLHGALRHEDKQLLATVEILLATFLALLAVLRIPHIRLVHARSYADTRARETGLHRGRERYRAFG
jgi:hypothetical protein